MEMVDMVITKSWISGRKSRSVNILSSSRIWDFDGISPPGSAVQTRRIHPPGQISQFHPPGLIMTCRVLQDKCMVWNTHQATICVLLVMQQLRSRKECNS